MGDVAVVVWCKRQCVGRATRFVTQTLHNTHIHLICPVRAGICKLNVSGFRCNPLPAHFSCTKLVLLLDIANWCVLSCYFNGIILIMNTLACSSYSG